MKYNFIKVLLCMCLLIPYSLSGQDLFSKEQMRQDLKVLKTILESSHSGLFRYQSEKQWNQGFEGSLRLPEELNLVRFNYHVRKLLSTIQCGHTASYIPRELRVKRLESESVKLMPFMLNFENEQATVLWSLDPQLKAGVVVDHINGHSVDSLSSAWLALTFQGDAGIETRSRFFLRDDFPFFFHDLIAETDEFELSVTHSDLSGKIAVDAVAAKNWRKQRAKFMSSEQSSWFAFESDNTNSSAYMRIRLFGNYELRNGEKGRFRKFLKQSFAHLREEKIERLVIDLRGNDGGEGRLGALLYSYIAKEPFQYFKQWELVSNQLENQDYLSMPGLEKVMIRKILKKHLVEDGDDYKVTHWYGTLKPMEPVANAFEGTVQLLVDGRTFSAASDFTAIAKAHGRVTVFGEETGGAYRGNNSGILVNYILPNSKIRIQVPLAKGQNNVADDYSGKGVLPDYELASGLVAEPGRANEIMSSIERVIGN